MYIYDPSQKRSESSSMIYFLFFLNLRIFQSMNDMHKLFCETEALWFYTTSLCKNKRQIFSILRSNFIFTSSYSSLFLCRNAHALSSCKWETHNIEFYIFFHWKYIYLFWSETSIIQTRTVCFAQKLIILLAKN